jgi:hypothetical protein
MDEHDANLLGLRAFPRSVGMLAGAVVLLATREPATALGVSVATWLVTYVIKSMLSPSIVDTNLWVAFSLPINAIAAFPIRWTLYIIMVVAAVVMGAPITGTLQAMGGLFLYDVFIVVTRGS